jgi:hypothetical protein
MVQSYLHCATYLLHLENSLLLVIIIIIINDELKSVSWPGTGLRDRFT